MTIKITDNLLTKPLYPGGQSDGTENVTRQFGNQTEQFARMPNVPNGWGGIANRYAGIEQRAYADVAANNAKIEAQNRDANTRAVQAVLSSVQDTVQYMDTLQTAEEYSRAKRMELEVEQADYNVREKLRADPEFIKQSTTDQQAQYQTARDLEIDKIQQGYNFSKGKVVRDVNLRLAEFKANSSMDYQEREIKPRIVERSRADADAADTMDIDKVVLNPTPENVAKAAAAITARRKSPESYAINGAANAEKLLNQSLKNLESATLNGFQETLDKSPLANLTGPEIDTENMTKGEVSLLIADQKLRYTNLVAQLPLNENERLLLVNKGEKFIDQYAKASVVSHNKMIKEQEADRKEQMQSNLDTWEVSLSMKARNGQLNERQLFSEYTKLAESPDFKDNPAAQKRLYVSMGRVESEITQRQRHQERLASERATRQTIAEMRMDSGIAISSSSAEQVFKQNGVMKSFLDSGQVVSSDIADQISKAGAVPSTILSSITTDLNSSDPARQQRGVQNLKAIKGYSSASQRALLRDLPDEYSGVINRLELGQSTKEALAFLTRPRATPDIEKKLKNEAGQKELVASANSVMKELDLAPNNMSGSLHQQLMSQWEDAYVRAGGDKKLAADLYRQDLAKNKKIGKSGFTGKIEQYPATNYGDKKIVTEIINEDFPETKGKDVIPVYNGMMMIDGKETPTYSVYIKENGMLTEVTKHGKPFYLNKETVAAKSKAQADEEMNAAVQAALKRKQKDREAELKYKDNASMLKKRPLIEKFGGN